MTKKDYEKFAEMFRGLRFVAKDDDYPLTNEELLDRVIGEAADVFQGDNPRFDRKRFLDKCIPVEGE